MAVAPLLLGATACPSANNQVTIKNQTNEGIHFEVWWVSGGLDTPRPTGEFAGALPGKQDYFRDIILHGQKCKDDVRIYGSTFSGRWYSYGPPICLHDTWTITDKTPFTSKAPTPAPTPKPTPTRTPTYPASTPTRRLRGG
jgi:hypothetical protein